MRDVVLGAGAGAGTGGAGAGAGTGALGGGRAGGRGGDVDSIHGASAGPEASKLAPESKSCKTFWSRLAKLVHQWESTAE